MERDGWKFLVDPTPDSSMEDLYGGGTVKAYSVFRNVPVYRITAWGAQEGGYALVNFDEDGCVKVHMVVATGQIVHACQHGVLATPPPKV